MRKTITIVGVGNRRQGTSKTGKSYDFTRVSFTYEDPWIRGLKAATCNFHQDCMPDYIPALGDIVEAVIREDFKTGQVFVEAII